ncbi:MAG: F0F1 ATP synthase subunit A [Terriglobales bacterium]
MHELWFTRVFNDAFGPAAVALRQWLHLPAANPPIPAHIAMEILVAVVLAILGTAVGLTLSLDSPHFWQHIFEWLWSGLGQHAAEIIGHGSDRFLRFLFSLSIFILLGNLLGLIPGFKSPTATDSVPLGLAIVVFLYYHAHGVRKHGVLRYLKTFAGPVMGMGCLSIPLIILMFPVEVISHFARMLSLTARLYANMLAGDLVIVTMTALFPLAGVLFMGLHAFEALLQAYIFVLLAIIYLSGAVAEEH